MPAFGGAAPQLALDRLSRIRGNGALCVIAAVYGNRAYEDTLVLLEDYAQALERLLNKKVKEITIYSFTLGKPITLS